MHSVTSYTAGRSFRWTTRYRAPIRSPSFVNGVICRVVGFHFGQFSTSARTCQIVSARAAVTNCWTVRMPYYLNRPHDLGYHRQCVCLFRGSVAHRQAQNHGPAPEQGDGGIDCRQFNDGHRLGRGCERGAAPPTGMSGMWKFKRPPPGLGQSPASPCVSKSASLTAYTARHYNSLPPS